MMSVVLFLVHRAVLCCAYQNENGFLISGLGCKRSQVQILSRRPSYLLEFIQYCICFKLCKTLQETAHRISKNTAKAWECGIVFGTPRIGPIRGHANPFSHWPSRLSTKTLIKIEALA